MMLFIIIVHAIVCVALIGLVLIQRGRGGGLVDSFQGVESMFGPKTNSFLTRSTTVLSVVFFFTCLSLAVLSVKQSKSLLSSVKSSKKTAASATVPANTTAVKPAVQETAKPQDKVTAALPAPAAAAEKTQEQKKTE